MFDKTLQAIRELPKVDLHCHIDGSIRPATIMELAIKEGILNLPNNLDDFVKLVQVDDSCRSLHECLKRFELPLKVFIKPENIRRITYEVLEDAAKEGVRYIEIRFAPYFSLAYGNPNNDGKTFVDMPEEKIIAALSAMEEAKTKLNIDSGLILCAMREEVPQRSIDLVNLANKYKEKGVVAVDLAGNEGAFPPEIHEEAFRLAQKFGIKVTVHAGETGISENVLKSIELLKADRIGHGISAEKDEKLMEYLSKNRIALEICIKSNIITKAVNKLESHPIKKFIAKGVKVTINTDDTTILNTDINKEYKQLLEMGVPMKDVISIMKNGIEASFAPANLKEKMMNEFNEAIRRLMKNGVLEMDGEKRLEM